MASARGLTAPSSVLPLRCERKVYPPVACRILFPISACRIHGSLTPSSRLSLLGSWPGSASLPAKNYVTTRAGTGRDNRMDLIRVTELPDGSFMFTFDDPGELPAEYAEGFFAEWSNPFVDPSAGLPTRLPSRFSKRPHNHRRLLFHARLSRNVQAAIGRRARHIRRSDVEPSPDVPPTLATDPTPPGSISPPSDDHLSQPADQPVANSSTIVGAVASASASVTNSKILSADPECGFSLPDFRVQLRHLTPARLPSSFSKRSPVMAAKAGRKIPSFITTQPGDTGPEPAEPEQPARKASYSRRSPIVAARKHASRAFPSAQGAMASPASVVEGSMEFRGAGEDKAVNMLARKPSHFSKRSPIGKAKKVAQEGFPPLSSGTEAPPAAGEESAIPKSSSVQAAQRIGRTIVSLRAVTAEDESSSDTEADVGQASERPSASSRRRRRGVQASFTGAGEQPLAPAGQQAPLPPRIPSRFSKRSPVRVNQDLARALLASANSISQEPPSVLDLGRPLLPPRPPSSFVRSSPIPTSARTAKPRTVPGIHPEFLEFPVGLGPPTMAPSTPSTPSELLQKQKQKRQEEQETQQEQSPKGSARIPRPLSKLNKRALLDRNLKGVRRAADKGKEEKEQGVVNCVGNRGVEDVLQGSAGRNRSSLWPLESGTQGEQVEEGADYKGDCVWEEEAESTKGGAEGSSSNSSSEVVAGDDAETETESASEAVATDAEAKHEKGGRAEQPGVAAGGMTREQLEAWKVKDLKDLVKGMGGKRYSKLKKAELVDLILQLQDGGN